MSDDDQTTNDDAASSQDDIDSMFDEGAAGGEGGGQGMDLDEIQEEKDPNAPKGPEYAVGEPMANDVTAIYEIPVQISAVLGRSTMQVSQLLKLGRGAVVELDRKVGEAIDIYVNNRLVARGEVVVVEDKLGITMTEIVKSDRS